MVDLDINELCDRAGVTSRTVYFYVQQGLLAPAAGAGPAARYTEGHVARLKLIRLLQKQHLPLAEIGKRIRALNDQEVQRLVAEARTRRTEKNASALDYIRGVLSESTPLLARSRTPVPAMPATPAPPASAPVGRSQWERHAFADGIELHVRRPLSRAEQRQVDKLMAAARRIFSEEGEEQS
ncbi:MAG TPA: MerR family transcriptional regulator [Vicinamibacterales bacterium]|nr:MerR family transcriptional regulator [Vicinamibacterales bacterium]